MTQEYKNTVLEVSMIASGAIRKYRLVKVSGNHTIAECDAGEQHIGISAEACTASGDVIRIIPIGPVVKAEAGATITAGNYVNANADGDVIPESTDGEVLAGIALNAADNGDYVSIVLIAAMHS